MCLYKERPAREYLVMNKFKEIDIAGNAHERGVMHGEQLRREIADSIAYYRDIFMLSEHELHEQAIQFQRIIADYSAEYDQEIKGIAEGSGQDMLSIVTLNARTEILALKGKVDVNECTSMCFAGPPFLGQTWDWGQPLEAMCAVMRITRPDGHEIRMLTEPGIIGKIGMNNAGLGVCLNILTLGERLRGVPIHIVLRAILDCRSADEATAVIDQASFGKSSNIIVADQSGACFDREFAGDETLKPAPVHGNFVHTNHYLGREINAFDDPLFFNSRARLNTATDLMSRESDVSVDSMIDVLSDRSHAQFPIYRPYVPDDLLHNVGTVATIIMDLPNLQMHIRKGNREDSAFTSYSVN